MAKKSEKQIKTKSNPVLWFLFAIVVPLIVAITIVIIIFTVAGFNVMDWAKNTANDIPVISSVIATDKEKDEQRTEQLVKDKISDKDEKIDALQANVTNLEETVDQLKQEIVKLENKNNVKTESNDEKAQATSVEAEKDSQLKSITASFEQMDPKQTALILQDLEEDMVIAILKEIPEDVRAGIFEETEPEIAAQYTKAYLTSAE
ncbi:MotE family protein [Virgibacillus necropolis]|uniref:Magnesium transporter MgtE intracellular domain-containing protein n=1 Tax=Virgibacillus necropolis TaxID=163877 RepID=A0A221MDM4_9BACI|nr:hypothetical protein [Virgibacillus necropolis]ASN05724.1 hypothetical protein CFK40_12245 [Virgibacillus necropolis]